MLAGLFILLVGSPKDRLKVEVRQSSSTVPPFFFLTFLYFSSLFLLTLLVSSVYIYITFCFALLGWKTLSLTHSLFYLLGIHVLFSIICSYVLALCFLK